MSLPPLPVLDIPPADEPWHLRFDDGPVLAGDDALAPAGTATPGTAAAREAAPPPDTAPAPRVLAEDAFPTIAELDAILAENAGPPPVPDAAARAEVAAMLGLDPAIAADPVLFEAAVADCTMPEPDPLPEDITDPAWSGRTWPAAPQDWPLG